MKKEIKTFDDYMADEERVNFSEREQILFEASIIGKMTVAREKSEVGTTPIEPATISKPRTSPLTKRSIYLTNEQYLQIRIRAAQEGCDGSQIVRKAIAAYFGNDECVFERS